MATSDWIKFNPKVKLKQTKKKMFGRFYYTVKYFCPGGRILLDDDCNIEDAIEHRKDWDRSYNYGGSWRAAKERLSDISIDQLEALRVVKLKYSNLIRMRIEEPYVTFHGETEETLLDIAEDLTVWQDRVRVVSLTTAKEKELLDRNCIIAKVDLGYKYKIVLRDGNFKNKQALRDYLEKLGDQVKISEGVWGNLDKPYPFLWGAWMYVNDPDISVMLNMIEAGIVSNIHEVVLTQ